MTFAQAELMLLRLWRRELHIESRDGIRRAWRWVTRAERNPADETFKLCFDPVLAGCLLDLSEWVMARKDQLNGFASEYAIRIYLWACAVRNQNQRNWEVSIEELRLRLGIEAKEYKRFSNFNARVLAAPIHEINTESDFRLKYTVLRRRRLPVGIYFQVLDGPRTADRTKPKKTGRVIRDRVEKKRARARAAQAKATEQARAATAPKQTRSSPEEEAARRKDIEQQVAALRANLEGSRPMPTEPMPVATNIPQPPDPVSHARLVVQSRRLALESATDEKQRSKCKAALEDAELLLEQALSLQPELALA